MLCDNLKRRCYSQQFKCWCCLKVIGSNLEPCRGQTYNGVLWPSWRCSNSNGSYDNLNVVMVELFQTRRYNSRAMRKDKESNSVLTEGTSTSGGKRLCRELKDVSNKQVVGIAKGFLKRVLVFIFFFVCLCFEFVCFLIGTQVVMCLLGLIFVCFVVCGY